MRPRYAFSLGHNCPWLSAEASRPHRVPGGASASGRASHIRSILRRPSAIVIRQLSCVHNVSQNQHAFDSFARRVLRWRVAW